MRADQTDLLNGLLGERILVLDGAMGTMIQRLGLTEADFRGRQFADHPIDLAGDNDLLSLTQPEAILAIHKEYLDAGSDIIGTNTFNATRISQADYGLEDHCYEMNRAAAALARRACDEFMIENSGSVRFVAGSLGPTGKTLSLSPDVENPAHRAVTFDQMRSAYGEAARGLIDGGANLLLVETIFDTLNAKAAIFAIEEIFSELGARLPVMISVTVTDRSGRTLSGQTLPAFLASLEHARPLSFGLNCSFGAREIRSSLVEIADLAPGWVSVYPNAGLPNAFGDYDEKPEMTGELVGEFARSGLVNFVGGCCGTTPDHIRAMARAVAGVAPRPLPAPVPAAHLPSRYSGLETQTIRQDSNFFMIGERNNVAGSRRFARLIREKKYESALQVAAQQVRAGANILDLNLDDGLLDAAVEMEHFLKLMASEPEIARLPVMVDSSRWEVLEIGLQCLQGKGVVNSISLKDGEAEFLRRAGLVRRYGAAVVVMAFDEQGQADSAERKIEIAERAYKLLTEQVGFSPCDIIMDVNVLAVATGLPEHRDYAVHFIEAVRHLKVSCPGVRFSGGISNLSFSLRGNNPVREAMHAVFLYHAIEAGLDMGIVNAGQLAVYQDIEPGLLERVEDVIFNRRDDATERLIEYAPSVKGEVVAQVEDLAWREGTLSERLAHTLIHGILDHLELDLTEALEAYPAPLQIIEGPLMEGMRAVGVLFGQGKMFLPQVVKSARAMKKAVTILQPHIEDGDAGGSSRGKILLATVKGDVHDIGKNIVSVVLGCNGYEIIDLGVMVPAGVILDEVEKSSPDIVGLSGLITPSLDEMVTVAREMTRRQMTMPLLIGGATTSDKHTAVKIAPEYNSPVVRVEDASRAADVVTGLLDPARRSGFVEDNHQLQLRMRREHAEPRRSLISIADARQRAVSADMERRVTAVPEIIGGRQVSVPLTELVPLIDWSYLFRAWEMKGSYPRVLDDPEQGTAARELLADAQGMLDEMIAGDLVQAGGCCGIWPAESRGDDLVLYTDESREAEALRIPMLRQQSPTDDDKPCRSLVDFIPPGEGDHVGLFALSAGLGADKLIDRFRKDGDDYRALLVGTLTNCLAEALSVHQHGWLMSEWGVRPPGPVTDLSEKLPGIRPAVGYPSCPDHSVKFGIFDLLGATKRGISLTESGAISPPASVCGFYFAHPDAVNFAVGRLGRDQVSDYAERCGVEIADAERWLRTRLNYEP
jgi:5-methyltetrahydrofolate--homocysteine methyltransferase